ncbi:MAG TPA: hypothetical protein VN829_02485, partial [Dongiaceae bacterium]|nr:hypothetical protein [Dongiaceae bacterium]
MAWQLIYTSAPRGLTSGQSGFCTVARSGDLREAVAQRLEQISSYHHLQLSSGGNPARNPIISAYRVLDIRGTKYHALTRIQATGLDFTARTNHLAQHLVFQADELARLPSPAAILHHWSGWLSCWQGEPRLLSALLADAFKEVPAPAWPAKAWERLTGDGGRAAALLESECVRGCYLLCPAGGEEDLLELFCETLQLPNFTGKYPQRAWQHTFTTFLQAEDALGDFEWRGCQPDTPAHQQAVRRSAPLLQLRTLRVPSNPLAKLAREGPKITSPNPPPASRAPLALRRQPSLMPPAKAPTPSPAIDFSQTEFVRRKPQVPESVGWTFSIRKTSLLAIGIALALLGGLIAIHRLHPTLKP